LATLRFSAHCQTENRASIIAPGRLASRPAARYCTATMPPRPLPQGFIVPCLATRADRVPTGPQWAHEIKHDGYRFIVRRDGDRVRIFSRRGLDWTDRVPSIVAAVRALHVRSAVIDGEAVVARDDGVTEFDALRSALASRDGCDAVFLYAFDLIELDDQDLRRLPWHERRAALAKLTCDAAAGIVLSEHLDSGGAAMFRHACTLGLEGVVSKRRDAPYRSGRCADWIKVKNPDAPAATRIIEG
jgi:bifunctional non-homologous end joining protein LigD